MLPYEAYDFEYIRDEDELDYFHRIPGVYILEHRISGYFYIGSTANLRRRIVGHFSMLDRNAHSNVRLQRAYRADSVVYVHVLECATKEHALDIELGLIDTFQDIVFNIQGNDSVGVWRIVSDETRQRLSESHRGYAHPEEQKRKISDSLKNHPDRERLIANKTGENHVRAESVVVAGISYGSIRDAQRATGIPWSTLMARIKSTSSQFSNYYKVRD